MKECNKNKKIDEDDGDSSSRHSPDIVHSFIPTEDSMLMKMIESSKNFESFNLTNFFANYNNIPSNESILIDIKVEFLKLGQIETKNERFDAEVLVTCAWDDNKILNEIVDQLDIESFSGNQFSFKTLNEVKIFNKVVNEFKFVAGKHKIVVTYYDTCVKLIYSC